MGKQQQVQLMINGITEKNAYLDSFIQKMVFQTTDSCSESPFFEKYCA